MVIVDNSVEHFVCMDFNGEWWMAEVVAVGFDAVGRRWYGGENKIKELDVPGWLRSLDTAN